MLTFVPHKINEDYKKVEFYRVNKELLNCEEYRGLSPTAILLYSLLCDRLSLSYNNELNNNNIFKSKNKDCKYLNYEERDYSNYDWSDLYANKK